MPKSFVTSVIVALQAVLIFSQVAYAESSEYDTTTTPSASVFLPTVGHSDSDLLGRCRFGVNGDINRFDTDPLRIGWYVNYLAYPYSEGGNSEVAFLPQIRLTQTGPETYYFSLRPNWAVATDEELREEIAERPGAEWFISNEPDRRDRKVGSQDSIEPQIYAIAYHDLYYLIKGEDPTAKIIAGSIVQPTEIRLQYLDMVLAEYQTRYGEPMPVDVWATHNFILNEVRDGWGADIPPGIDADSGMIITLDDAANNKALVRMDLFVAQIERFRQWLYDNGYRDTPVYVSEYGVLFPDYVNGEEWYTDYSPSVVNHFMNETFEYMLTESDSTIGYPADEFRLVQRFSWYSIYDPFFNGSLFMEDGTLSELGANYASYSSNVAIETDFFPVRFSATRNGDSITLRAVIANAGSLAGASAATVRFYNGDPAAGGVRLGPAQAVSLAGCGENTVVSYILDNAGTVALDLYVAVTPASMSLDAEISNNVLGPLSLSVSDAVNANTIVASYAAP